MWTPRYLLKDQKVVELRVAICKIYSKSQKVQVFARVDKKELDTEIAKRRYDRIERASGEWRGSVK
jgi:hypothetical protein